MSGANRVGPPQTGGLVEELLEFPGEVAQTGEFHDIMTRAAAEQIRLLQIISGARTDVELVGGPPTEEDFPSEPTYFSSGREPIAVDNTSMENEKWDFVARTVNLRFTDAINVAFVNPENNEDVVIRLAQEDSPFSTSGVQGLFAREIYYEQDDTATGTPDLDIIAIQ